MSRIAKEYQAPMADQSKIECRKWVGLPWFGMRAKTAFSIKLGNLVLLYTLTLRPARCISMSLHLSEDGHRCRPVRFARPRCRLAGRNRVESCCGRPRPATVLPECICPVDPDSDWPGLAVGRRRVGAQCGSEPQPNLSKRRSEPVVARGD